MSNENEKEINVIDGDDEQNLDDKGEQAANVEESEENGRSNDQDEETPMKENVSFEGQDSENTESEDEEGDEDCQESEDDKNTGRRQKRECPLSHCDSKVVHLPRHLRNVHNWSKEYARTAISRFRMRKRYEFSDKEKAKAGNRKVKKVTTERKCQKKPCRKRKLCPITGCMTSTDRLPQHLQRVHKLQRTDAKYKESLSRAKVISSDRPHIFLRMKQERQRERQPDVDNSAAMSPDEKEMSLDESGEEIEEMVEVESDDHKTDANEGSCDLNSQTPESADIQSEDVSKTLRKFRDWLVSPDGGKKDGKTAKQHVSQLNRVLSVIGEGRLLSSLVDTKKIRDIFLQQYAAENYHASTIKSYLMSLQHYCSFLVTDQLRGVRFDKEEVLSLREKLMRWSSSYKRENTRPRREKTEEDRSALITPHKIREFERNQAATEAIILLGQLCEAHTIQITQEKYTLVRDYLIVQIMIDNANRAGVVTCVTVQEFERATLEADRYVVRVLCHKTLYSHGAAQMVLKSHLYNYVKVFMKEMRSQLPNVNLLDKKTAMFLSWGGKPMESSQMTKPLGSIFQKAGGNSPMHHTLYHKSAVSRCHDEHKEISGNLADLMAHREVTVQKYYRVLEKGKSSVKASQKLHGIMRNPDQSTSKQQAQTNSQEVTERNTAVQDESLMAERERWREESINAIRTLFAEEISAQNITISCVRQKIQDDPILSKEEPKRVYDRVRAEWRFRATPDSCDKETANLPEEYEFIDNCVSRMFQEKEDDQQSSHSSNVVSPTDTTGKSQGVFAAEQVQALLRLFQDMINGSPISKPTINATLAKDSLGKSLLEKFTLAQIVNRLKYERKQKREKQKTALTIKINKLSK